MRHHRRTLLIVFFSILFTACAPDAPAQPTDHILPLPTATTSLTATPERAFPGKTPTVLSTTTASQPVVAPSTVLLPTPQFTICSPLAWETIPELAEIVADPYHPPPPERAEERHHGVDFSHYSRKGHDSILGEPVQAVLGGVVAASITDRLPYGNMVIIETFQNALPSDLIEVLDLQPGQSLYLLYAHLQDAPLVELGEMVACGQALGAVGKTGYNIVNEHLHLETRRGPAGVRFESMAFYTATASVDEMSNYNRWRTGGEFLHFDPFDLFEFFDK